MIVDVVGDPLEQQFGGVDLAARLAERRLHRGPVVRNVIGIVDPLARDDAQKLLNGAARHARRGAGDAEAEHGPGLRFIERRRDGICVRRRMVFQELRQREVAMRGYLHAFAAHGVAAGALQAGDAPIV